MPPDEAASVNKRLAQLVSEHGFSTISEARVPNEELMSGEFAPGHKHDNIADVQVSTVGFHLKGYPELIFIAGPLPGELPLSNRDVAARINSVYSVIENYFKTIHLSEILPGEIIAAADGRLYMSVEENPVRGIPDEEFRKGITSYYGTTDYKVIYFYPLFSDQLSIYPGQLSKKRH